MNKIWYNRLVAGTVMWEDVPESRRPAILALLRQAVESGTITPERYEEITGEAYEE